jgi:hypothetical protein
VNDAEQSVRKILVDTVTGRSVVSEGVRKAECPCCGRIGSEYRLLQCTRDIGTIASEIPSGTITLSEPILVGYSNSKTGESKIVFENAAKFDDGYALQIADDPGDIALDIRDEFDMDELANRFAGMRLPVKFGIVRIGSETLVIEFGGKDRE